MPVIATDYVTSRGTAHGKILLDNAHNARQRMGHVLYDAGHTTEYSLCRRYHFTK